MNEQRLLQVLLGSHDSEKATRIADKHRQYTFKVAKNACKPEIKQAVENLFKVEVDNVTTSHVKLKQRRTGRIQGVRSGWKKAQVTLKAGHSINFIEAEA